MHTTSARAVLYRGHRAAADAKWIFSPELPIGKERPNRLSAGKEGDVMTPLCTVLLCLPAGLALIRAVCGLAVL